MKSRVLSIVGIGVCILFLSGCATAVRLNGFAVTELDKKKSQYKLPKYVVDKKKPKVAVLPLGNETQMKLTGMATAAQDSLTNMIAENCGVEVSERSQLQVLLNEHEQKLMLGGNLNPKKLNKLAESYDAVFVGSIASVDMKANFTEARTWTDDKGKRYATAPSCKEQASIVINLRCIAFPAGTVQQTFSLKGIAVNTFEVRRSSECKNNHAVGLVSEAVQKAVKHGRDSFKNSFPRYGYVYKTMTNIEDPKKRIAFINMGVMDGLKAGHKIDFIEFAKESDSIKNTLREVQRSVGEGIVSETDLTSEHAIVLIPEVESGNVIVGSAVRSKNNSGLANMFY